MRHQTFKASNYMRMERWSDSANMKRHCKRSRRRADRRDAKDLIREFAD